jgi:hypothetical protein
MIINWNSIQSIVKLSKVANVVEGALSNPLHFRVLNTPAYYAHRLTDDIRFLETESSIGFTKEWQYPSRVLSLSLSYLWDRVSLSSVTQAVLRLPSAGITDVDYHTSSHS